MGNIRSPMSLLPASNEEDPTSGFVFVRFIDAFPPSLEPCPHSIYMFNQADLMTVAPLLGAATVESSAARTSTFIPINCRAAHA
jgi:hypothetical protein